MALVKIAGRYKRPGRPGHDVEVVVHRTVAIRDSRGKAQLYFFGIRTDAEGQGFTGLFRVDGFMTLNAAPAAEAPKTTTDWLALFLARFQCAAVAEKAIAVDNWYVTGQSSNFAFVEEVEDADDRVYAEKEGGTPLSQYVVDIDLAALLPKA